MTDINKLKVWAEALAIRAGSAGPDISADVLGLIEEVEKLRADTSSMRGSLNANSKCMKKLIKDGTRAAKERDRLRVENEVLRRFAAEAYQVLGALDAPENVLDNASDAANGLPLRHETLLPFFAEDYEALRKDAARYRWLRDSCTRQWDVMYRDIEVVIKGDGADDCEDLDGIIDAALEGATQ
ncbi:TPA: hypothetical protein NHL12_001136 [Pseudomonas aeruginosa]|nr:hypothetical protein [Pseudomonas aeruginosa]